MLDERYFSSSGHDHGTAHLLDPPVACVSSSPHLACIADDGPQYGSLGQIPRLGMPKHLHEAEVEDIRLAEMSYAQPA